jgi:hypothetical protein
MKVKTSKIAPSALKKDLPGYPAYPANDDIYKKYKEEDVNPEEISRMKESETKDSDDFDTPVSGSDLDIPGAELDDLQESIGSEDEENNYYSLGGDDHNDLEEDKGE